MSLPQLVIFIGAVTAALGALWASSQEGHEKVRSANEKAKFEKELREKSEEQLELLKGIYSLLAKVKSPSKMRGEYFQAYFQNR